MVYIVPDMIQTMFERAKIEEDAGVGQDVVGRFRPTEELKSCPRYAELYSRFRRFHGLCALVNLVAMGCNAFHMYHLACKLIDRWHIHGQIQIIAQGTELMFGWCHFSTFSNRCSRDSQFGGCHLSIASSPCSRGGPAVLMMPSFTCSESLLMRRFAVWMMPSFSCFESLLKGQICSLDDDIYQLLLTVAQETDLKFGLYHLSVASNPCSRTRLAVWMMPSFNCFEFLLKRHACCLNEIFLWFLHILVQG